MKCKQNIIDTARIVCGAGSMKRSSVHPSPSVCLSHLSPAAALCNGFPTEHLAGKRYRWKAAGACAAYQLQARSAVTVLWHGAQQQMQMLCWQTAEYRVGWTQTCCEANPRLSDALARDYPDGKTDQKRLEYSIRTVQLVTFSLTNFAMKNPIVSES